MDEWKLKCSLIDYPKTSHAITVPEGDIKVYKYKDLKTRRREDYVARGSLFVLDLGFLSKILGLKGKDGVEKEFSKWRKSIVELSIELRERDDFEGVRKEWEEMAAFGTRGYERQQQPDTIINIERCTVKVVCFTSGVTLIQTFNAGYSYCFFGF